MRGHKLLTNLCKRLFPTSKILALSAHVTIQDSHEVAAKRSNLGPIYGSQFFNGKESIRLGEHSYLALDLVIHFLLRTEAIRD